MDNTIVLILIFAVLIFVAFYNRNLSASTVPKVDTSNIDYNSTQGKIFNRFFAVLSEIKFQYNLSIPTSALLAVINQESSLLFQTKKNSEVKGDGGNSIGYMQASNYAVLDSNKAKGTNFSFKDLLDERKNLEIGSIYLDVCYNSALKNKSSNPIRLAFEKYNGGVDETDALKNAMAERYAESAYKYFLIFQGFLT